MIDWQHTAGLTLQRYFLLEENARNNALAAIRAACHPDSSAQISSELASSVSDLRRDAILPNSARNRFRNAIATEGKTIAHFREARQLTMELAANCQALMCRMCHGSDSSQDSDDLGPAIRPEIALLTWDAAIALAELGLHPKLAYLLGKNNSTETAKRVIERLARVLQVKLCAWSNTTLIAAMSLYGFASWSDWVNGVPASIIELRVLIGRVNQMLRNPVIGEWNLERLSDFRNSRFLPWYLLRKMRTVSNSKTLIPAAEFWRAIPWMTQSDGGGERFSVRASYEGFWVGGMN